MTEFNLSEKRTYTYEGILDNTYCYSEKDVKEFIRLLKEAIECDSRQYALEQLDKLAGEKLT